MLTRGVSRRATLKVRKDDGVVPDLEIVIAAFFTCCNIFGSVPKYSTVV